MDSSYKTHLLLYECQLTDRPFCHTLTQVLTYGSTLWRDDSPYVSDTSAGTEIINTPRFSITFSSHFLTFSSRRFHHGFPHVGFLPCVSLSFPSRFDDSAAFSSSFSSHVPGRFLHVLLAFSLGFAAAISEASFNSAASRDDNDIDENEPTTVRHQQLT